MRRQAGLRGKGQGWRAFGGPIVGVVLAAWMALGGASSPTNGQEIMDTPDEGLAHWAGIERVLTHPRCLNCHTMTDHPTQGDERRPHALGVKRGPDGHGASLKCQSCHRASNQSTTGIPGAPDWHMAPLSLIWEKAPGAPASGAVICASLKRPDEETGEPDYERLIEYAQFAPFVLWAWDPGARRDGARRATPPISHEAFVEAVKAWISAGAPCPPAPEETAAPVAGPPTSQAAQPADQPAQPTSE